MDGNIPKSDSMNVSMYVKHVEKEYKKNHLKFTWKLPGFFKQKMSTLYTKQIEALNFNLILKKDKDSFDVTLHTSKCEMFLSIFCNIIFDGFHVLASFEVHQISKNLYQFRLQPSDFKYLKNCVLNHSDILELQFVMNRKMYECFHSDKYIRDNSRFREFKTYQIVFKRFSTDFVIKSNDGKKFHCPRSLLAARSNYFRYHFSKSNNKKEMLINNPSWSVGALIYYLYSGSFYTDNISVMLDTVKLAWDLDIPSLKSNCDSLVCPFINSDSVSQIKNEGIKLGLRVLVEKADKFLENVHALELKDSRKFRNT